MLYYELWIVLWNWRWEFTTKEFSATFASPDPNKVLHDMTKKGLLERVGWGKYRVNSPEDYMKKRTNLTEAYNLLKSFNLKYSLTGPDAFLFGRKAGIK